MHAHSVHARALYGGDIRLFVATYMGCLILQDVYYVARVVSVLRTCAVQSGGKQALPGTYSRRYKYEQRSVDSLDLEGLLRVFFGVWLMFILAECHLPKLGAVTNKALEQDQYQNA